MSTGWKSRDSLSIYLTKWAFATGFISVVSLNVLPLHEVKFEVPLYYLETFLWFILSAVAAVSLYFSSFPERAPAWPSYVVVAAVSTLLALTFTHASLTPSLVTEFSMELDSWRGRCGLLITVLAFIHSIFLFRWARTGAARSPMMTGMWAALSAAALGCFLMQPVCLHDNSMHLWVWHFVPMAILCFIGSQYARFMLKW